MFIIISDNLGLSMAGQYITEDGAGNAACARDALGKYHTTSPGALSGVKSVRVVLFATSGNVSR